MKKSIVSLIRLIIPDSVWRRWKRTFLLHSADVKEIEKNPQDFHEILYHIKDDTWEPMCMPSIYRTMADGCLNCFHAAQDILLVKNAIVTNNSNIVISNGHVIWDKSERVYFSKVIPRDNNLLRYDDERVYIRRYANTREIKGRCISMLGTHANIWGHFLVQYLPKLFYADKAEILDNTTLLIPHYSDGNIKEMLDMAIAKHKNVSIVEAIAETEYFCDELIYMPNTSYISDEANYMMPFEVVIPKDIVNMIHQKIAKPIIEKIKDNTPKYDKLYLTRDNPSYRATLNIDEVNAWFKEKNFHFIEGGTLSLEEKADLFYHAKTIAGPYSSAWINTFFCNKAKGLVLTNIPKSIESYFLTLARPDSITFLHCIGADAGITHQSDFRIPISTIEAAYKQLTEEDDGSNDRQ